MLETMLNCVLGVATVVLALLLIAALYRWFRSRVGSVDEGYVVPIQWFGRHQHIKTAGPYILWPGQQVGTPIKVRQQETSTSIPNIYTRSGLPITVNFRYSMHLSVADLHRDELYFDPGERQELQVRIFRDGLQRLVMEERALVPTESRDRAELAAMFGPFFGTELTVICRRLRELVKSHLADHGIILAEEPLVVDCLSLPPQVITAYEDLQATNFDSAAQMQFITRIRNAAPGISEGSLVQLFNAITHNSGEVRTIFATGSFNPALYMTEPGMMIGMPAAPASLPPPRNQAAPPEAPPEPMSADNRSLTVEEMATLKPPVRT